MCFVYIGVFMRYTTHRRYAVLVLVPALIVVVVTTVYAVLGKTGHLNQSQSAVEDMVGWFTAAASVSLYISPLATVRRVLQTKNSASIPLALCFAGLMENLFWLLYGLLKKDVFMWAITASCALFALLQVLLCFVFPAQQTDQDPQVDIDLAKLSTLSSSSAVDYTLQSSPRIDRRHSEKLLV